MVSIKNENPNLLFLGTTILIFLPWKRVFLLMWPAIFHLQTYHSPSHFHLVLRRKVEARLTTPEWSIDEWLLIIALMC
jgi:hypothetical protein